MTAETDDTFSRRFVQPMVTTDFEIDFVATLNRLTAVIAMLAINHGAS